MPRDVVAEADPSSTLADLAEALGVPPADLCPAVPGDVQLSEAGLLSGQMVGPGLVPAGGQLASARPDLTPGTVRLEVVGGPFAGTVVALRRGVAMTVGTSPAMAIRLVDPAVDSHHATVQWAGQLPPGSLDASAGSPKGAKLGKSAGTRRRNGAQTRGRAGRPAQAAFRTAWDSGTSGKARSDEFMRTGERVQPGDFARMVEVTPSPEPTMVVTPVSRIAPVIVNGEPITQPRVVGGEDIVQIGATMLRIGVQPRPDGDVHEDQVAHLAYNRSARIRPAVVQKVVTLPGERPADLDRTPLPWLSALIPVLVAVVAALVFKHPYMLIMAAASPLMVVGGYVTSRKNAKRSGKRTADKWRAEVVEARADIAAFTTEQRIRSWRDQLDPVTVLDVATTPTARLWERRAEDPDALWVRVGAADVDLDVRYDGTRASRHGVRVTTGVSPCPVGVDLGAGVVGIAGPPAVTSSIARAMLAHLAAMRSPRDLRVVVLCDDGSAAHWQWVRWLPHTDGGQRALALIGNTDATRKVRLRELGALLDERRNAERDRENAQIDQHTVVFVDQARVYRTLPGMATLLATGPQLGVMVVAMDADRARLPQECATEVIVDPTDITMGTVVSVAGSHPRVLFDGATPAQAETLARALAPVIHVAGAGDDNLLPQAVRLVDVVGADLADPAPIMQSWMIAPRDTRAVVGAGPDGTFAVDLAADGPHGLVAGTTGAGKSEFLQTLVVSLALVNRPDALNFVLVDYKGGSAFADCERLPHTVGLVTNLDGRQTERALESLNAELERRERVLRDMGAKDVDAAWERDADRAATAGLARLVLVIDEFAELKAELPDFVSGLVRIARVGRSLGVQLILATQRPSGAITAEMQSNTNLRVALRVTDKSDSTDVLGSIEAAAISPTTPGRGFARRGAGAAPIEFQTARVAGRRPGAVQRARVRVAEPGWAQVGMPVRFAEPPAVGAPRGIDHDDTDLRALVDVITAATARLGVPKNPSPWLAPLPDVLTLDEVATVCAADTPEVGAAPGGLGARVAGTREPGTHGLGDGAVVLGVEDIPAMQRQSPLQWRLVHDSHIALLGGARSGRTSTLRVIAAQLARDFAPDDVHLYAVDYGNGALAPLARLPHCGAVIAPDPGRLARFWARLLTEIGQRQAVLAAAACGDIREQRATAAPGDRLAFIAVLIDGWERLVSDTEPDEFLAMRELVIKVLREGPAVGIRVVMAGDRGLLFDKVAGFIDTRYLFPLTDRQDYRMVGYQLTALPEVITPGQVFFGAPMREARFVLLPGSATGEAQQRALVEAVDQAVQRWAVVADGVRGSGRARPFRLDLLPVRITVAEAAGLPAVTYPPTGVTIAVGGDDLSRFTWDPQDSSGFVVAGERRCGRSTALAAILEQSVDRMGVLVVATREGIVRDTAEKLGITPITDPKVTPDQFFALLDDAAATSARLSVAAGGPGAGPSGTAGAGRVLVVCDDVEHLRDTPIEEALLENRSALTLCVSIHVEETMGVFRGIFAEAKKSRQGLLLSPSTPMHGVQCFGAQIPRALLGSGGPGRAVVFTEGEYTQVQVPLSVAEVTF